MNILLLFLAILPGLVISFFIFKADRFEKESKWLMFGAFVLGALITYPTMLAEGLAANLGWEESRNFFKIFFFAIIFVGLIEELFKFICLAVPYFHKEFNEPLDGIVYAVLIAMGFATLENVIYAYQYGLQTIILRAFTAVPAHGAFAVIMGYYAGLSKIDKPNQIKLLLTGLGLAAFLHGIYDFFIIQPYAEWLMPFATLVLILSLFLAYKMIQKLQVTSPFNPLNVVTEIPEDGVESTPPLSDLPEHNDVLDAVIKDMEDEGGEGEEENP